MKKSIKKELMLMFIGLAVGIMLVFLIINGGFLEKFYITNKQSEFIKVYEELKAGIESEGISLENPNEELNKLAERNNIALLVLNQRAEVVYISARSVDILVYQLQGYLFDKNAGQVLQSTDGYVLNRTWDPRNNTEYIEMWGRFENGDIFIMRSPLESIRTAVSIFNRFVCIVGILLLLVSCVAGWYFSKRLTEPILELAQISQKMANLDFEAKYTRGGEDEIGILGQSFNQMSEKLKQTITDLKQANYELQKDLEQREKMEVMRNEFVGNVSHELKTPIALIQGYAEGLKDGISEDPESQEFYCEVIMDEAEKMNRLVKNLLTLNQLEHGEEIYFERFDVVLIIKGILQSLEVMIAQKEARIAFPEEEPVYVWSDQFKVEQVLRNYITNALNHVDGDRVIEIRIQIDEDVARVSVFNTGEPIPEEDIPHIWDKFYKVDKARTREYGGNGIGLSIVKAIMDAFHRDYGVENYSNGVKFWFEIDMK